MNNYKHVINLAKDLQEEFKEKLSTVQALQIAAQIHQIEVLSEGLLVTAINKADSQPVALEAIASVLGVKPNGQYSSSILEVLKKGE